jgi:hypothetical protein
MGTHHNLLRPLKAFVMTIAYAQLVFIIGGMICGAILTAGWIATWLVYFLTWGHLDPFTPYVNFLIWLEHPFR